MADTPNVVRLDHLFEGFTSDDGRGLRIFRVVFDTWANGSILAAKTAVLGSASIPSPGSDYAMFPALYAQPPRAAAKGAPNIFEVTVEYRSWSTPAPEDRVPTASAWLWSWTGAYTVERVDKDVNNVHIANSAGVTFAGVSMEKSDPVARGRKYLTEAEWGAINPTALRDTVNNAQVVIDGYTIAANEGRLRAIDSEPVTINGVDYRLVTVEVQFRQSDGTGTPWQRRILDESFRDIDGVRFMDVNNEGKEVYRTDPTLLDGTGHEEVTATPNWLYFTEFAEADWSGLDFA